MLMVITDTGKVGSKGELFPPKKIRQAVGLSNNQKVRYSVINGKLIVEPIPDPVKLLSREPKVRITLEEYKKNRSTISSELEG